MGRREKLTIRQLIARLGGGRGHRTFTGTPEQVADAIEQWFRLGAADGFNIMAAVLPSGQELFVDHVVPILRAVARSVSPPPGAKPVVPPAAEDIISRAFAGGHVDGCRVGGRPHARNGNTC